MARQPRDASSYLRNNYGVSLRRLRIIYAWLSNGDSIVGGVNVDLMWSYCGNEVEVGYYLCWAYKEGERGLPPMAMPAGRRAFRAGVSLICIEIERIITKITFYGGMLFPLNDDHLIGGVQYSRGESGGDTA